MLHSCKGSTDMYMFMVGAALFVNMYTAGAALPMNIFMVGAAYLEHCSWLVLDPHSCVTGVSGAYIRLCTQYTHMMSQPGFAQQLVAFCIAVAAVAVHN